VLTNRACRGVNIIELMIAIAIMSVMVMLGLPTMTEYLRNSSVRAAAETILNGTQLARSEAIRRNSAVEFVLIAVAPSVANVSAALSNAGPHWMVRVFQTAGVYTAADFIQGGDTFSTPNVLINADTASFNFGGLGRTNLPGDNVIRVTYPSGGDCVNAGGTVRCLNIVVKIGGQIRMCDPAVTTVGDTRAC
jgi:type IV fimbrial biogenesis protein FimT